MEKPIIRYVITELTLRPSRTLRRCATCRAVFRRRDSVSGFQRTYHRTQTSPMKSRFRCSDVPSPSPHKLPSNRATLTNLQVPPFFLSSGVTCLSFSDPVAADGQIYLLFIPGGVNFPQDGIRYMEPEQRYTIPLPAARVRDVFSAVLVNRIRTFLLIGT